MEVAATWNDGGVKNGTNIQVLHLRKEIHRIRQ